LEAKTITFSVWSNMPLSREPRQGRFDQLFWTASKSRTWRRWTLEGALQGYVWQGPPGEPGARTVETAGRMAYTAGPITLFTVHTLDVAAYRGSYFVEAGATGQRRWRRVQWTAQAQAGAANGRFNRAYAGVLGAAVNFVQLDLSASVPLKRGWSLRPHLEATQIVSPAIRRATGNFRVFNAGVALGWEF
jgi:hypothetical protein